MKFLIALGLVIAIALLALKLASAPLYAVYDASDCHSAYSRSRTLADSARVDLHPYNASGGASRHTCGEVRARRVITPADISALRQPNEEL
jgi:hypothetical protein